MANALEDENSENVAQLLAERGLTCGRLKGQIKRQMQDAQDFRKFGFDNIAEAEEQIASKLKTLKNKVCLMR